MNENPTLEMLVCEYYQHHDFNCAETLLHACNDFYDLQISPEDFVMMAGFGGGLFTGNLCGALVGCNAALSKLLVTTSAHDQADIIQPATRLLVRNFRSLLSDTQCAQIKSIHHSKESGCLNTCLLAAQAMEQTVAQLQNQ